MLLLLLLYIITIINILLEVKHNTTTQGKQWVFWIPTHSKWDTIQVQLQHRLFFLFLWYDYDMSAEWLEKFQIKGSNSFKPKHCLYWNTIIIKPIIGIEYHNILLQCNY